MDGARNPLLRRVGADRTDAALALAFTLAGLVQTLILPIAPGIAGPVYVLGATVPLAWRRTRPIESSLVMAAFWLIPLDGFPVLGFVVVILQFFALGSRGSPRIAVVLTTLLACTLTVVGTLLGPEPAVATIGAVLAVAGPVLVGQVVARLRQQNERLAALAEQLREERRNAEEAAVGAERARIAQELHDVVGHEVTLIAIQAEAATAALSVNPDRAAEPVEAIRDTAHRTLAQMRAVLDVVSPDGQDLSNEDVAEISRRAEQGGIANTLTVTGEPWPAQSPAVLAVGRIVRECLTNAGRHSPGAAVQLDVAWAPDAVRVHASNELVGSTDGSVPGRGLTGMRHRAQLLGGTFTAGTSGGRFEVDVMLPAPGVEHAADRGAQHVAAMHVGATPPEAVR